MMLFLSVLPSTRWEHFALIVRPRSPSACPKFNTGNGPAKGQLTLNEQIHESIYIILYNAHNNGVPDVRLSSVDFILRATDNQLICSVGAKYDTNAKDSKASIIM